MKMNYKGFNPEYSEEAPTREQINGLIGYAVLEFGTPWCSHCQAAKLAVQEVLNEHDELIHIKVYDGKDKVLGRSFRVKLWPTLILLYDGKEVARLVRPVFADEVKLFITK